MSDTPIPEDDAGPVDQEPVAIPPLKPAVIVTDVEIAELVPVDALQLHPRNTRVGDVAAIEQMIRENGFYGTITVQRSTNFVLAGNHRLKAARNVGLQFVPVSFVDVDDATAARILVGDNRANDLATYEAELQLRYLEEMAAAENLVGTGYTDEDLEALRAEFEASLDNPEEIPPALNDPDDVPAPPQVVISRRGDVFLLGEHRVMCGDSTIEDDVLALMGSTDSIPLLHADPPYGMGKEADGVENDNLYEAKLDAFQMDWWRAWRPYLAENASAYIWGNAADLWRLWYNGGLSNDPDLMVRNEIVWDKQSIPGMKSAGAHSYPNATERCLFLMMGKQFLGMQNKEDFWQGYEPLRSWLEAERNKAGWTNGDVNKLTNKHMAGHWFSQSQFFPIPKADYLDLQAAANGTAFVEDYDALFEQMFPDARDGGNEYRRNLAAQLREQRSFFDNTHDIMRDVWTFGRVVGDERHDHATPKPVEMIERCIKSSCPPGGVVVEPFGGSGSTLIAAYTAGRRCFTMEITPMYVDTICKRFERHTGVTPILEATGEPVSFLD